MKTKNYAIVSIVSLVLCIGVLLTMGDIAQIIIEHATLGSFEKLNLLGVLAFMTILGIRGGLDIIAKLVNEMEPDESARALDEFTKHEFF